jgi:hypothetical protein
VLSWWEANRNSPRAEGFHMGSVNETMRSVNTTLRTLLMTALVGGAGYGGYVIYDLYHEPRQKLADKQAELDQALGKLASSEKQLAETAAQLERTQVAMQLLKVRHRLARLKCLDQKPNPDTGRIESTVEFVEVNDEGLPIGEPKQFKIEGKLVYVDYLTVKFDDKYIEQSDLDRSTALALFQRIFGEHDEPIKGQRLDDVGTRPTAYARGTPMSDFEQKIWDDFWLIANDPARAREMGIIAINGEAPSMVLVPGKTYEIEIRSTGGISFRAVE